MKTNGALLEDFVVWTGIVASEPIEEEEMSSLSTGFSAWMRKRVTGSEGESTSNSGEKGRGSPLEMKRTGQ